MCTAFKVKITVVNRGKYFGSLVELNGTRFMTAVAEMAEAVGISVVAVAR